MQTIIDRRCGIVKVLVAHDGFGVLSLKYCRRRRRLVCRGWKKEEEGAFAHGFLEVNDEHEPIPPG